MEGIELLVKPYISSSGLSALCASSEEETSDWKGDQGRRNVRMLMCSSGDEGRFQLAVARVLLKSEAWVGETTNIEPWEKGSRAVKTTGLYTAEPPLHLNEKRSCFLPEVHPISSRILPICSFHNRQSLMC